MLLELRCLYILDNMDCLLSSTRFAYDKTKGGALVIELEDWIAHVKERKKEISSIMRVPKRPFRGIKSRSEEESDALARAVIRNWNNALESGILRKEADGSYTICGKKKK
jgi:hypothetical protein